MMDCTEQTLLLRLQALSCPFAAAYDASNPLHQQRAIAWLEDAHLRVLRVPARAALRQRAFAPALHAYLRRLGLPPPDAADLRPTVARLVDRALALHYADHAVTLAAPHDPWQGRCVPVVPGAAADVDVLDAVAGLLQVLGVRGQPKDAVEGARVAAAVVGAGLVSGDGDVEEEREEDGAPQDVLKDLPLGFSTGNEQVDRFAKVVRLLHVRRVRELQDAVNAAVAEMQAVTADPKTDSKLGRVGR